MPDKTINPVTKWDECQKKKICEFSWNFSDFNNFLFLISPISWTNFQCLWMLLSLKCWSEDQWRTGWKVDHYQVKYWFFKIFIKDLFWLIDFFREDQTFFFFFTHILPRKARPLHADQNVQLTVCKWDNAIYRMQMK